MENVNQQATSAHAASRSRYVGPSAGRIADLLPDPVRFERGWLWTSDRICHGGHAQRLAFRQRPNGEGIDVRCHEGGCRRSHVISRLEAVIGLPIDTAYAPGPEAPASPATPASDGNRRVFLLAVLVVLLAAPLALGYGAEVAALNAAGFGWTAWAVRRLFVDRLRRAARRRR